MRDGTAQILARLREAGVVHGEVIPCGALRMAYTLANMAEGLEVLQVPGNADVAQYWVMWADDAQRMRAAGYNSPLGPARAAGFIH